jgi:hypothetical protein
MTKTYMHPDLGIERPCRRVNPRLENPRAAHLFDGFRNRIESAQLNGDTYAAGYMAAMVAEIGKLAADMQTVRSALERLVDASTPDELAGLKITLAGLPIPDGERATLVTAIDALITTA